MADNSKRQSVSSRVVTPKPASQGPGELDAALSKAIGASVKLTTVSPVMTLEGTIYTACPITNLVAISTATAPSSSKPAQTSDFHIIPISRIQSFSVISIPSSNGQNGSGYSFENAMPSIGRVDLQAAKAREDAAIKKLREQDARKGKGVGKEGQDIFDALARTLPARWHDTTMIISESVMIAKPYRTEDCSAPKEKQPALDRVKKVLEDVRRKLAAANRANSEKAGPPNNVRKGG